MEDVVQNSTSVASAQGKRLTVCHPSLVKGMTDEDAQSFDASYQRAKRVLRRLNEVSRQEYLKILNQEEDHQALGLPNYGNYVAFKNGERRAWKKFQELTRTK